MVLGFGSRNRRFRSPEAPIRAASPVTLAAVFLSVGTIAICGLCGGAMYYFQPHVSEDPASVQPLLDELVTIRIPQSDADPVRFTPRGTIQWNLAFLMSLRGVYFQTADTRQDGVLMFLEVNGASLQKPDVRTHVDRMLKERTGMGSPLKTRGDPDYQVLMVRGQPAEFTFETAVDPASDVRYRLISGVIPGNRWHDVLITLRVNSEPPWDDSVAISMIESIQ